MILLNTSMAPNMKTAINSFFQEKILHEQFPTFGQFLDYTTTAFSQTFPGLPHMVTLHHVSEQVHGDDSQYQ